MQISPSPLLPETVCLVGESARVWARVRKRGKIIAAREGIITIIIIK